MTNVTHYVEEPLATYYMSHFYQHPDCHYVYNYNATLLDNSSLPDFIKFDGVNAFTLFTLDSSFKGNWTVKLNATFVDDEGPKESHFFWHIDLRYNQGPPYFVTDLETIQAIPL